MSDAHSMVSNNCEKMEIDAGHEEGLASSDSDGGIHQNNDFSFKKIAAFIDYATEYPFYAVVRNLPAQWTTTEFREFVTGTYKFVDLKINAAKEEGILKVFFMERDNINDFINLLNRRIWQGKRLQVVEGNENASELVDDNEVVTIEEEILAQELTFLDESFEKERLLALEDAHVLSVNLHVELCDTNPALGGWAENACEENRGTIFEVDPVDTTNSQTTGYRTKFLFEIGENTEGKHVVGLVLSATKTRPECIVGIEPEDRLIQFPYNMKLAAKAFEDFMHSIQEDMELNFWRKLRITTSSDGILMVPALYAKGLKDDSLVTLKKKMVEYFGEGPGRNCNILSLYLHISKKRTMRQRHRLVYYDEDEMIHLMGKTFLEESIGGLVYSISPYVSRKFSPHMMEKILDGLVELGQPTKEMTVVSICGWPHGLHFAFAKECMKTYAIDNQSMNLKDMERTKELNNLDNVEIVNGIGRVEAVLIELFDKLKDKPLIILIGQAQNRSMTIKVGSILRAQPNIVRIVGICADNKSNGKVWTTTLSAPQGRDRWRGAEQDGLPFVPIRAKVIDTAPYRAENTILILSERVDPSKYPPPTKPLPIACPFPDLAIKEKIPRAVKSKRSGRDEKGSKKLCGSPSIPGKGGYPTPLSQRPVPPPLMMARRFPGFPMGAVPFRNPLLRPPPGLAMTLEHCEQKREELQQLKMLKAAYEKRISELTGEDQTAAATEMKATEEVADNEGMNPEEKMKTAWDKEINKADDSTVAEVNKTEEEKSTADVAEMRNELMEVTKTIRQYESYIKQLEQQSLSRKPVIPHFPLRMRGGHFNRGGPFPRPVSSAFGPGWVRGDEGFRGIRPIWGRPDVPFGVESFHWRGRGHARRGRFW